MPAVSLPPPSSVGSLTVASLPSLHATFTSEHAILEQLLYKNKNQHRKANYYQKLMAVARSNRHIDLTPTTLSTLHTLHNTADTLRSSLLAILQAAEPLYALLRQTYFMPFALTSLAVLARLLVVCKAALLVVLAEAKEREESEEESVRLFAARSVGTALLRALRERRVEDVVVEMAGYELTETWAGGMEAVEREPAHSGTAVAPTVEDKRLPPPVRSVRQSATDEVIVEYEYDDDGDDVLSPTTVTARVTTTSTPQPHSAPPSATKQPSTSRTAATLPANTPLRADQHLNIQSKPPISHSVTLDISATAAPTATPSALSLATTTTGRAGSKKRKAVTVVADATQLALKGRSVQQSVGLQRTVGNVKAVKVGVVNSGKPSAAADDIDEIFGF